MPSKKSPDGSARVIAELARAPEEGIRARRRLLVLAAHPDDESLGASAALGRCATSAVAFLADGATRDARFRPGWSGSRETYAHARRQEALAALALVQVPPDSIFWIGGTDQETIYELDRSITRFAEIVAQFAPEVVITHPYEGGHPDHDTAALVASAAIGRLHGGQTPELLEMTSYHARAGQRIAGEFLPGISSGSAHDSETRLLLNQKERDRKARMLACYASQEAVLRDFPLQPERLRPAPAYDFTRPPHAGPLWYECLGWPLTGEQWRENAALLLSHS